MFEDQFCLRINSAATQDFCIQTIWNVQADVCAKIVFLSLEPDSAGLGPLCEISFLDICKERPRSVYPFPLYSHICQQTTVNTLQCMFSEVFNFELFGYACSEFSEDRLVLLHTLAC